MRHVIYVGPTGRMQNTRYERVLGVGEGKNFSTHDVFLTLRNFSLPRHKPKDQAAATLTSIPGRWKAIEIPAPATLLSLDRTALEA